MTSRQNIHRVHLADQPSTGRAIQQQPSRRQEWEIRSPKEILASHRPGKSDPLRVLEVLIELFNARHTAFGKTVSHKTREERAKFLRRFFRDLRQRAGFPSLPDPRNLGQRHIHAMVQVWGHDQLAPATIQTYLSFLRGLASWMGKHGFVRKPAHYGLLPAEYERHEAAQQDRSWVARGVDVQAVLEQVQPFDARIAASLRLMHALALRRKESVTVRPLTDVVPFSATGQPDDVRSADFYIRITGKGGRVRWLPLASQEQQDAVAHAQRLVESPDGHLGDPDHDLKYNLRRLDYAMRKFGLTRGSRGVTMHGLRHERLQAQYRQIAGTPAPVCSGGNAEPTMDRAARLAVSQTAGHARVRAAAAYLGQSTAIRSRGLKPKDPRAS